LSRGAPDGYRWQALAIVSLGTLTVHLDTAVNVALPAITDALQAPLPAIQWIIIGYVLTTASTLVGVGRLTDLIGRRTIWNWGLIALALALLLDGLARSIEMLVVFRIFQAVGATMVYAAGPAIVTEAFPSGERGRALGIMTMGGQVGMAVGPLLGGWLVATFGWPAIFWARAPIALALGLASFWVIRDLTASRGRARFDFGGAATLGLAMVALLLGINQAGMAGWAAPLPLGLFAVSIVMFAVFVWLESRLDAPMVDLALFRNRLFTAANLTNLLANLTMFGVWLLVPYYLVDGLGLTSVVSGLLLSCVPTATALVAPLAGWLSDRVGSWSLSLGGLVLQVVALFLIARLDGESSIFQVAAALVLLGTALGLFLAPNLSFIMGAVPRDQLGVAGGMVTTMRSLGVVTSVAMLTSIYSARSAEYNRDAGGPVDGSFVIPAFQDAFTIAALLCLAAVGLALIRGRSVRAMGDAPGLSLPRREADQWGRAAHGDVVRTTPIPAPTRRALAAARRAEDAIRFDTSETLVAFDRVGTEVLRKTGDAESVDIETSELRLLSGAVITHNHPGGAIDGPDALRGLSFSESDVRTAAWAQAAEVRVVTAGWRYSLRPPLTGWNLDWYNRVLHNAVRERDLYRQAHSEALTDIREIESRGEVMTQEERGALAIHLTWRHVAEKLGMHYTRTRVRR
jgi:EmrB/QacA subfamily drug resistance transporter